MGRNTSRIGEGNCGPQKKITDRKHQAKLQQKYKKLNQIIDSQRPIYDKAALEYNQQNDQLGSYSKTTKDDKKSYMDIVKENLQEAGTCKHEENEHAKK